MVFIRDPSDYRVCRWKHGSNQQRCREYMRVSAPLVIRGGYHGCRNGQSVLRTGFQRLLRSDSSSWLPKQAVRFAAGRTQKAQHQQDPGQKMPPFPHIAPPSSRSGPVMCRTPVCSSGPLLVFMVVLCSCPRRQRAVIRLRAHGPCCPGRTRSHRADRHTRRPPPTSTRYRTRSYPRERGTPADRRCRPR